MRSTIFFIATVMVSQAFGQGHGSAPSEMLSKISFLRGNWVGKQDFNTGGAPMTGDAIDNVTEAIGGRYLEEKLSTTLPGRKPTDTRHYITFDPKSGMFKAWWFNDTAVGPTELIGSLDGNKLVLMSKPTTGAPVLRATYDKPADGKLDFTLEMQSGESWRKLFKSSYTLGPSG